MNKLTKETKLVQTLPWWWLQQFRLGLKKPTHVLYVACTHDVIKGWRCDSYIVHPSICSMSLAVIVITVLSSIRFKLWICMKNDLFEDITAMTTKKGNC